jgi:hypothetical protein
MDAVTLKQVWVYVLLRSHLVIDDWTHKLTAMDEFKPRIVTLVQDLQECIASFGENPVNVTDIMTWFSFDVISEVLFWNDFGMIKARAAHPVMAQQKRALALLGLIIDV